MNKELEPSIRSQIDYWPHPITADNRHVVFGKVGQTLEEIMSGKLPHGVDAFAVVNGVRYERRDWKHILIRQDDVVQIRATMHGGGGGGNSNPLRVILSIAVIVAAPFAAGALAPTLGITAGTIGFGVLQAGIAFAGLLAINSIFPPRYPELPSNRDGSAQPPRQFSLSGGANRARPNEPIAMCLALIGCFPIWWQR